MSLNVYLLIFALAFMGCVLATPLVVRVAAWAGAIDRPDQFRRIHKGAIPRMGGLALGVGLLASLLPFLVMGDARFSAWQLNQFEEWWARQWAVVVAGLIVLGVGAIDDARGLRPLTKLLGQTLAVLVLMAGDIRIPGIELLGLRIPLSYPIPVLLPLNLGCLTLDPPSLAVTLLWFLGCMNIWNLIDGMDGLASGVGLLVSGTLMLVALHQGNFGSAATAAALAGALAGFLLYNWHPACIFLGDSGALLIGLLLGVIGVQDSLKATTSVSILFPLLAMGLPISDTAMAIFRRWVRDLPLSSADRQHVHHLLIGLGLGPRRAAAILYFFTAGLCGVVLMGVAWRSEFLALVLGVSGCLAFLVVLTSRRDELASLLADLQARSGRKRQERMASELTWQTIQRIQLCDSPERIWPQLEAVAQALRCDALLVSCQHADRVLLDQWTDHQKLADQPGSTASVRLRGELDLELALTLHQTEDAALPPDIAFRALQRLAQATCQRLEDLLGGADDTRPATLPMAPATAQPASAARVLTAPTAVAATALALPLSTGLRETTGRLLALIGLRLPGLSARTEEHRD